MIGVFTTSLEDEFLFGFVWVFLFGLGDVVIAHDDVEFAHFGDMDWFLRINQSSWNFAIENCFGDVTLLEIDFILIIGEHIEKGGILPAISPMDAQNTLGSLFQKIITIVVINFWP